MLMASATFTRPLSRITSYNVCYTKLLRGNNAVNIAASSLATSVLISWFGQTGIAYATLGMTLIVLIFSEIRNTFV